jgi:pyridoxal phosphate enzyme (YggS family)
MPAVRNGLCCYNARMSEVRSIAGNVAAIRERIGAAARRGKRRPEEITLVAISKGVPAERIREAFAAGVRHFGESRVQEWESKASALQDLDATWHLVGHLQRNKAARAVSLFHAVDSVDALPLAERLDRAAGEGKRVAVLLEVRLDMVGAKAGCPPEEVPRIVEGLLLLSRLEWRGLMTIAPMVEDPEDARAAFRHLREMRDSLAASLKRPLPELSMGMTHDFEVAIEEGATQVRIGTAIFGARAAAF